jgi:hypothetical protein
MPGHPDDANQALEEFPAYLETLTFIQIDPQLRAFIHDREGAKQSASSLQPWPRTNTL